MRVLITGGTSGIGRAVAVLLGEHGHDVDVAGGRDEIKGQRLIREFSELPGTIRFYPVDLSSIPDVKRFADLYLSESSFIDALFLNAGVFERRSVIDNRGRDKAFVVNYLHRFMLNFLLKPVLVKGRSRVLINGSSNFAYGLDLDEEVFGRRYSGMQGMTQALYANGFLTYWYNHKFPDTVPVQSIHPGYVNTKMVKGGGFFMRLLNRMLSISPEKAAEKIVTVLEDHGLKNQEGAFFKGVNKSGFSNNIIGNPELFDKLWHLSLDITGLQAEEP